MRLLLDENISRTVIRSLRERGHDVLSAKESLPGQPDQAVLARASAERRLVVTHDKDFGELAFRSRLPAECGVLLLRMAGTNPDVDNARLVEAIESRDDWAGHFSVVTKTQVRVRSLPSSLSP